MADRDTTTTKLDFNLAGENGKDGRHGIHGEDGIVSAWQRSRDGRSGSHAGPAASGQGGGYLRIELSLIKTQRGPSGGSRDDWYDNDYGYGDDDGEQKEARSCVSDDVLLQVTAEGYDQDTNTAAFEPGTVHTCPIREFRCIKWNVEGGNGGHGGYGGNGTSVHACV